MLNSFSRGEILRRKTLSFSLDTAARYETDQVVSHKSKKAYIFQEMTFKAISNNVEDRDK